MSISRVLGGLTVALAVGVAGARAGDESDTAASPGQPERYWPVVPEEATSFWFAEFWRIAHDYEAAYFGYWVHTSFPESPWHLAASRRVRQYEDCHPVPKEYEPGFMGGWRYRKNDCPPSHCCPAFDLALDDPGSGKGLPSCTAMLDAMAFNRVLQTSERARNGGHPRQDAPDPGTDSILGDNEAYFPLLSPVGFSRRKVTPLAIGTLRE